MNHKKNSTLDREKIIKGLEINREKLLEFKKEKNSPLVISKNGEIMEVEVTKADSEK